MPGTRTNPLCQRFGKRVHALRAARHIPQKELAHRAGISPAMLSRIEVGQREPRISNAYLLARELQCSLDLLMGEEPPSFTIIIQ